MLVVLVPGGRHQLAGDGFAVVPVLLEHVEQANGVNQLHQGGVHHEVDHGLILDALRHAELGVGVYHPQHVVQNDPLFGAQDHLVRVVDVELKFVGCHLAGGR